jgi:hypothetical protein
MANTDTEDFNQLKSKLAKSLKEILTEEAVSPELRGSVDCVVDVPYDSLVSSDDEHNTAYALVTYTVFCPTEKKNTVQIKFKYDSLGNFLRKTMSYV